MNIPISHPSPVRLRTATPADAETLSTLGARLFAQTFGPDNTPEDMAAYLASAFAVSTTAAELAERDRMTWIAEDAAGATVGYAVLIRGTKVDGVRGERPAEVRRIYVDRTLHGQSAAPRADTSATAAPTATAATTATSSTPAAAATGTRPPTAGALLLDRCVAQARAWNCDVIWLAVWEHNPRAIRFYEKHGFIPVARKDFQLGSDLQHDFVMARNL